MLCQSTPDDGQRNVELSNTRRFLSEPHLFQKENSHMVLPQTSSWILASTMQSLKPYLMCRSLLLQFVRQSYSGSASVVTLPTPPVYIVIRPSVYCVLIGSNQAKRAIWWEVLVKVSRHRFCSSQFREIRPCFVCRVIMTATSKPEPNWRRTKWRDITGNRRRSSTWRWVQD